MAPMRNGLGFGRADQSAPVTPRTTAAWTGRYRSSLLCPPTATRPNLGGERQSQPGSTDESQGRRRGRAAGARGESNRSGGAAHRRHRCRDGRGNALAELSVRVVLPFDRRRWGDAQGFVLSEPGQTPLPQRRPAAARLLLARAEHFHHPARIRAAAFRHARQQDWGVRRGVTPSDRPWRHPNQSQETTAEQHLRAVSCRPARGARRHRRYAALADRFDQPGDRPGFPADVLPTAVSALPS